jgi:hypothetical protein
LTSTSCFDIGVSTWSVCSIKNIFSMNYWIWFGLNSMIMWFLRNWSNGWPFYRLILNCESSRIVMNVSVSSSPIRRIMYKISSSSSISNSGHWWLIIFILKNTFSWFVNCGILWTQKSSSISWSLTSIHFYFILWNIINSNNKKLFVYNN